MSADVKSQMEALDIAADTGHLAWVQSDPIVIKNTGSWEIRYADLSDIKASDFVLRSEITWEATSIVYCGVTFRSDANRAKGNHYELLTLRISGLPAWWITFERVGKQSSKITGSRPKFSSALNMGNGDTNELILIAKGNEFNVYINGVRQSRAIDDSKLSSDGYFGAANAQDAGSSSCTFENTWIWVYDE